MKTFICVAFVSLSVSLIVSCSQRRNATISSHEEMVLSSSAFFPGSKAPGFSESTDNQTDGGFIEGPGTNQGGGDGGFIAGPNDAKSNDNLVSASPSDITQSVSSISLAQPVNGAAASNNGGQTTDGSRDAQGSSTSNGNANNAVSTTTAGTDGGFLPSGTVGGQDQGSLGVQDNVASSSGWATASPSGLAGSSDSSSTSTGNAGVDAPGTSSDQTNGTNGGVISNASSAGTDGGNTSVTSNVSPNATQSSASLTDSSTGSTGAVQPATPTSPNSFQWAAAASSFLQLIQSVIGQPGTDGGTIPGGGNSDSSDGGSVNSGNSGVSNGSSQGNGSGNASNNGNSGGAAGNASSGSSGNDVGGSGSGSSADSDSGTGNDNGSNGNSTQSGDKLDVHVSRVCSVSRSAIPYPKFIFFEEAKTPRLTMELVKKSCNYQSSCHSTKENDPSSVLVSLDLRGIDMMEKRFSDEVYLNAQAIKNQYPLKWRKFYVKTMVCEDSDNDGRCSDESGARMLSVNGPSFTLDRIPRSVTIDVWNARHFTRAEDPEICEKQYSPLILDLAGDGFKLTSADAGVSFDLNASGMPISTAWVTGSDDAFLVLDRNGNGVIDDGGELFGSATTLASGKRAVNGFEALKEIDSNQDGVFSRQDEEFSRVRLWLDRNKNGVSERSELVTLARANVKNINLGYKDIEEIDQFGNQTRQRSTFTRRVKGQNYTLQIIDIWFNTLVGR